MANTINDPFWEAMQALPNYVGSVLCKMVISAMVQDTDAGK